jgi:general stress protein 26
MADQGGEHDVWAVARKQRIAMLTVEEQGRLVSRPMASLVRPEDHAIYFVTQMDAKVSEVGGSSPVNLAYSDAHDNTYLSISGTAHTSQDREKLRALWSMFTEAWLPQGPDGEDVALITVEPEEAKLWDSTSSNLIYAGKVLKAVMTQRPPDGGTIEEVKMGGASRVAGGGAVPDRKLFEHYEEAQREAIGEVGASSLAGPAA